MCTLIKNNKLVVLTVYSRNLYPLIQVLCSVLEQDFLNKPHHISHTLIVNCTVSLYLHLLSCRLYIMYKHHLAALAPNMLCMLLVYYVSCNLALAPLILVNYSVQFYFLVHCCGHVLTMTTSTNITSGCNMNTIADIGVSRSGRNTE